MGNGPEQTDKLKGIVWRKEKNQAQKKWFQHTKNSLTVFQSRKANGELEQHNIVKELGVQIKTYKVVPVSYNLCYKYG